MFKRLQHKTSKPVSLFLDGRAITAQEGDTVAAAVLSCSAKQTRTTSISGSPRAPFCLMGVCFECLMIIDGVANQRACMTQVQPGMQIERQVGPGKSL